MCSLMMISDMLSNHVGAVKSVLKKWFKINDTQLLHLLVVWYIVNHMQWFQIKPKHYWNKGLLDVHKRLELTFILRICGHEKRRGSRWALFLIPHLKLQGTIADLSPYTYPQQTVRPTHLKVSLIKIRHLFFLVSEIDFLTLLHVRNPVGSGQGDDAQTLGKIIGYIYWGFAYCPLE